MSILRAMYASLVFIVMLVVTCTPMGYVASYFVPNVTSGWHLIAGALGTLFIGVTFTVIIHERWG